MTVEERVGWRLGEAPDMDATVLVIGYGSIGARHVANLLQLGPRVLVLEPDEIRAAMLPVGVDRVWEAPKATHVVICTPASSHRLQGCPLPHFVEKPLSDSSLGAHSGFRCEDGHSPRIQVGYQFRFNRSLIEFRERVRRIRGREEIMSVRVEFGYDVRKWRADGAIHPYIDTGILLEASHELDMIRWIFGDPVNVESAWTGGRKPGLLGRQEDTAFALLFAQGIPVELHLDMTRPDYRRRIEVVGSMTTATWFFTPDMDLNDMYLEEMRTFLGIGEPGAEPANFDDGIHALSLVEEIRAAAAVG